MGSCPNCGEENPERARFCLACATPLAPPAPERRKLATLLFCDMSGSTALGERVDAESLREMLCRYFETMEEAIERHGGTVEKFVGDAVLAAFGVPEAHEDDALRAVRAAWEMQERLLELNPELERRFGFTIALRIGLNTGEVVVGDATTRQMLATGDAVNVAARLEQAAGSGDVLLGESTYRLVRDAVTAEPVPPLSLKGKSEPLPAYRLVAVTAGAAGRSRRLEGPMVAREDELRLLEGAFAEAVQTRSCQLVTVVGEPGVGKSRLAAELLSSLAGKATILQGRCLSYGEGITFWPIGEIVREAAAIHDQHTPIEARERIASLLAGEEKAELVATRVSQAIGLEGGQAASEEIAWAIRKLFEALARSRPLLLFVDDIHWAESALLDLLAALPTLTREAPILLLCLARPELLEQRPDWEAQARLEPLAESDSGRLLENLLGNATIAPAVRERIVRAAGGNPLFVEELIAMLVEDGLLRRENGSWLATRELAEITLPATLGALLGARLDRLGEERATLERGAIEGQVFHRGAVAALSSPDAQAALAPHLATLVAKELIRPTEASFADDAAYRFRHVLIRDAAYQGTPKKLRVELHERFAGWLEREAGERAAEYEEILGYHLEQAYRYRKELGPIDERGRALAYEAAQRLASAGRRAFSRGDMPAAANLLERATSLPPPTDPGRLELLPSLAEAYVEVGDLSRAGSILGEAMEVAQACCARSVEAHALVVSLLVAQLMGTSSFEEVLRESERACEFFAEMDDQAGLAKALRVRAYGFYPGTEEALQRAVEHAGRAGDRREEALSLTYLSGAALYGSTPVALGIRRCQEILQRLEGFPSARANTLINLGGFHAMQGQFEKARQLIAEGRSLMEEFGLGTASAEIWPVRLGDVELLADDLAAAEHAFGFGYKLLVEMNEKFVLPAVTARLAEVLYRQGRLEEAYSFTKGTEELAPSDDVDAQARWRASRAKLLARQGKFDEAQRMAREAADIPEGTADLNLRGDVQGALAEVWALSRNRKQAESATETAVRLYEEKGNVVSAGKARVAFENLGLPVVR